jgi:hypothetical protein
MAAAEGSSIMSMRGYLRQSWALLLASAALILIFITPAVTLASNGAYSDGNYSACTYNTCGISLTSNGTVSINVTPGASTTCTTQSDGVAVTTDSSTGYTLSMNDNTTSSSLLGSGAPTVPTSSATQSSPSALSTNTWGYRVDGVGGFGAGPTSASSNTGTSSTTFAGIPTSSQTAATLVNSGSAADPAVTTTVWYGICVDATIPADTYSSTVVYTAVVN